jgi:membrane protease YdiL (CAAX protease family)
MEPEEKPPSPEVPAVRAVPDHEGPSELLDQSRSGLVLSYLNWVVIGSEGLRAGWSVLLFFALYRAFSFVIGSVVQTLFPAIAKFDSSPTTGLIGELIPLAAMMAAAAIVARLEHRTILDYNLKGPRRVTHFLAGAAAGIVALSALVGTLDWGGWLHFGALALSGVGIFKYAALWAVVFLVVGLVEEGSFRCYLQFTLTRGMNFWWALAVIAVLCGDLAVRTKGNGVWGVYFIALLGLVPCLMLHLKQIENSGFWQAAWVTSTAFGFIHTGNNGENWIGIFTAAGIGFVFCVSVRLTGSAWWAIGCHAAWDWAETYFYGTADSGMTAQGHYMTAIPAGAALWSGGSDGPEGSVLVIPVVLLLLVALIAIYGRQKAAAHSTQALGQAQA